MRALPIICKRARTYLHVVERLHSRFTVFVRGSRAHSYAHISLAMFGQPSLMKILLTKYSPQVTETTPLLDLTALHLAAIYGSIEVMPALLDAGDNNTHVTRVDTH